MRAIQCRSCRLTLYQATRGLIGVVRRRCDVRVWRVLLAIFLLTSLVTLLPLSAADPSDSTWLVGIYDEADGDSVVWLIDGMELRIYPEAAKAGRSDVDANRSLRVIGAPCCHADAFPRVIFLVVSPSRAPPLDWRDSAAPWL